MRELGPAFSRNNLHEVLLDFRGIAVLGKAQALTDSLAVGVDDYSGRAETFSEQDVCRFPAYAVQFKQLFHGSRHISAKFLGNCLARLFDGFCLLTIEATSANCLL